MIEPQIAPAERGGDAAEESVKRLRQTIGWLIVWGFGVLFLITVAAALFLGLIIGTEQVTAVAIEKMAFAASVQVAFGMVIGYASVWIGLMMTWFGVNAAYELSLRASAGEAAAETSLKSASPGLLFALGGIILIAVSLYKPIVYEESGGFPRRLNGDRTDTRDGLTPRPLPPRENQ